MDTLQHCLFTPNYTGTVTVDPWVDWLLTPNSPGVNSQSILTVGIEGAGVPRGYPPLQYWLFSPELRWQPRGKLAYLTGVWTGNAWAQARTQLSSSLSSAWLTAAAVSSTCPANTTQGSPPPPTPLPYRIHTHAAYGPCREGGVKYTSIMILVIPMGSGNGDSPSIKAHCTSITSHTASSRRPP